MNERRKDGLGISRRGFLAGTAAGIAGLSATPAMAGMLIGGERVLRLHNIHTSERLETVYWQDGQYLSGPLDEINHLLRDWRAEEATAMDIDALDLLNDLAKVMETNEPFDIISGYRSPNTNAALRAAGRGVARRSMHMQGKAIDVTLPGRDLNHLHTAAVSLKRGGVGKYAKSGFIHVDTGRVRYW